MFQGLKSPCVMTRTVREPPAVYIQPSCFAASKLVPALCSAFIYHGTGTQTTKVNFSLFLKAWWLPRFPFPNCSSYSPCCPFFKEVNHAVMALLPEASVLEEKLGTHHPDTLEMEERLSRGVSVESHSGFLLIHPWFFHTTNTKRFLS